MGEQRRERSSDHVPFLCVYVCRRGQGGWTVTGVAETQRDVTGASPFAQSKRERKQQEKESWGGGVPPLARVKSVAKEEGKVGGREWNMHRWRIMGGGRGAQAHHRKGNNQSAWRVGANRVATTLVAAVRNSTAAAKKDLCRYSALHRRQRPARAG